MKCPNCGVDLTLKLTHEPGSKIAATGNTVNFSINRTSCSLSDNDIIIAAKIVMSPDTIRGYYVELEDGMGVLREFPINQVVRKALEITNQNTTIKDIEDYFTSQRAKNILTKLGFTVKTKGWHM